jgi:hypothetical protein
VAIKFMDRGKDMLSDYVEREIINHSILMHPHVIQFKEVAPPTLHVMETRLSDDWIYLASMRRRWFG